MQPTTIKIDNVEYIRSDSIQAFKPETGDVLPLGQAYFIRTVTYRFIGILVQKSDKELILKDASWIADSGRWSDALKNGTLNEVEPYPDDELVIINRSACCDITRWKHPLPREQK